MLSRKQTCQATSAAQTAQRGSSVVICRVRSSLLAALALILVSSLLLVRGGYKHRNLHKLQWSAGLQLYADGAALGQQNAAAAYQAAVAAAHQFTFPYKPRKEVVHMLFLATQQHYLHNMDRFLYKVADAAMIHPQVNATVWGPGWDGYLANLSLAENVQHYFGCGSVDVTFAKLGSFTGGARNGTDMMELWKAYRPCGKETTVEELADCHSLECLKHATFSASHVVTSRFAFIPIELFYPMPGPAKMFAHIPDCAEPHIAMPVPWNQKRVNVTLIGYTWDKLYPLRVKIKASIRNGLIPGAIEHEHPGYASKSVPDRVLGKYALHAPAVQPLEMQLSAFLRAVAQSRICMFDSSIVRKGIAKYFEAMMCGCVVAADVPFEMEDILGEAMIKLHVQDTPLIIADKINAALANPDELQRKAARGIILARQHFTCQHKLERILDAAQEYKEGFRGYHFPFGFRIGCHSYFTGDHRPAHPWCNGTTI